MYKCKQCLKCFEKKYNYERHVKQKRSCGTIKKKDMASIKKRIPICERCGKTFSKPGNLKRHQDNPPVSCTMLAELKDIKSKLEQPQTIINQTINNIQGPTINLNIKLATPGEEKIDHISDETLLQILSNNDFTVVLRELMRQVYFNKDAPQNSHWCVAYPKQKYGALQYNTDTEIIERMVTARTVNKHYENMLELLSERMNRLMRNGKLDITQLRNINRFYQYVGTDSIEEEHDYEDVKMMAYNNRSIPVEVWKDLNIQGEHLCLRSKLGYL